MYTEARWLLRHSIDSLSRTLGAGCLILLFIMGTAGTAPARDTTPPEAPTGMTASLKSGAGDDLSPPGGQGSEGGISACAEADEGGAASLSCSGGRTITSIDFASYEACADGYTPGGCHAADSQSIVEASCLNQAACTVSADNGVFGDPCAGTSKRIAVAYTCSGDGGDACPDDPDKTEPGQCGCGVADTDRDGDGTADCKDNCPSNYNPDQADSDNDGIGDACDNEGGDDGGDDGGGDITGSYQGTGAILPLIGAIRAQCAAAELIELETRGFTIIRRISIGQWTNIVTIQASSMVDIEVVNALEYETKRLLEPIKERYPDRFRKLLDMHHGTFNIIQLYGSGWGWTGGIGGGSPYEHMFFKRNANQKDGGIFHEFGHVFDLQPYTNGFREHIDSILTAEDAALLDLHCVTDSGFIKNDGTCAYSEYVAESFRKMYYPDLRETLRINKPDIYNALLKYIPTPSSYIPFDGMEPYDFFNVP